VHWRGSGRYDICWLERSADRMISDEEKSIGIRDRCYGETIPTLNMAMPMQATHNNPLHSLRAEAYIQSVELTMVRF